MCGVRFKRCARDLRACVCHRSHPRPSHRPPPSHPLVFSLPLCREVFEAHVQQCVDLDTGTAPLRLLAVMRFPVRAPRWGPLFHSAISLAVLLLVGGPACRSPPRLLPVCLLCAIVATAPPPLWRAPLQAI